jgi:hypothetical protein
MPFLKLSDMLSASAVFKPGTVIFEMPAGMERAAPAFEKMTCAHARHSPVRPDRSANSRSHSVFSMRSTEAFG